MVRLLVLLVAVFALLPIPALSQQESEEIFLSFEYSAGGISTPISGRLFGGKVYLPLIELFQILGINVQADSGKILHGFFIHEENRYSINIQTGEASVQKKKVLLFPSAFLSARTEYYSLPQMFYDMFGLRFTVDMQQLQVSLETVDILPIVAERERQRNRAFLQTLTIDSKQYPLLYPRDRRILSGGLIDYSLTGATVEGRKSVAYDLRAGLEAAGGDLELGARGSQETNFPSFSEWDYKWRYTMDATVLTQVALGTQYAAGLSTQRYRGVSVSNEPLQPREYFTNYVIEDRSEPDWTVELYIEDRLIAATRADAAGLYRFTIPLYYGTTSYTIRQYGPTGEIHTDRHRIQLPFTNIPKGEAIYTASIGTMDGTNDRFLQGRLNLGITDALTYSFGGEVLESPLFARGVFSHILNARAFEHYLFSFEASPAVRYRADMNVSTPSQLFATVSVQQNQENALYNTAGKTTEGGLSLMVPWKIAGGIYSARASVSRINYTIGSFDQLAIGGTASFSSVTAMAEYQSLRSAFGGTESSRPVLTTSFSYHFDPELFGPNGFRNVLVGLGAGVAMNERKVEYIRISLSTSILTSGRLQLEVRRNILLSSTQANLQFVFEFPWTRSTSSMALQEEILVSQNIRGSLWMKEDFSDVEFFQREWVGKSGVVFRSYLDSNGDGVRQSEEKNIEGMTVNIHPTSSLQRQRDGALWMWDLLPYTYYKAEINDVAFENGLIVPRQTTFSFITEPNIFKEIEIPLDAVGSIEGTVLRQFKDSLIAVAGLRIHVRCLDREFKKSIPVFQDGSVYFIGIPPGRYQAEVDSTQLKALQLVSSPPSISFIIKAALGGDNFTGLAFILSEKKK